MVEVREKEASAGEAVEVTENQVAVAGGAEVIAESHVFALHSEAREATTGTFTRDAFEDALDKVSRPVKGKYADVPYSSEDLIRDKRTEVDLEDRPS